MKLSAPGLEGILPVYKPQGPTSHDVVAMLRRALFTRRIGHGGTLDPMAEGLLIILVGRATKASDYVMDGVKEYVAELTLGLSTDTQDIWGKITRSADPSSVTEDALRAALLRFTGPIEQVPPMYSAIKQGGQALYSLARKGVSVARPPRAVEIFELELMRFCGHKATLRIVCGKGTYIRTLCHDIGEVLRVGGCMSALTRTRSGIFSLAQAADLGALRAGAQPVLLPVDTVFLSLPRLTLNDEGCARALNGAPLDARHLAEGQIPAASTLCRVYGDGRFLMLSTVEKDLDGRPQLLVKTGFY